MIIFLKGVLKRQNNSKNLQKYNAAIDNKPFRSVRFDSTKPAVLLSLESEKEKFVLEQI